MKIGNIIAVILILGTGYAIYQKLPASTRASLSSALAALIPHDPTPAEIAQAHARLQRQMVNDPRWRFRATVIGRFNGEVQGVSGTMLLLRGLVSPAVGAPGYDAEYLALFDLPGAERAPDGFLIQGLACPAGETGTPHYGTVRVFLFTDHDAFDVLPKFDYYGKAINRDPNGPFVTDTGGSYQSPLRNPARPTF